MLLVGLLFGAIHIDSVQTFIARRLTSYLSDQLKTTVKIDRVSIRFIKSIVLEGFYLEDLHGDTLIFADELNVSINDLSTKNRKLVVGKLILKKGNFNLIQYHGEEHDNLHFITEYFSSGDTNTSGNKPWNIKLDDFSLREFNFRHLIEDDTSAVTGVNFSNLDVKNINGDFKNFRTVNDSMFVDIHSLSFSDHCGFKLDELSADAKISGSEIRLNKLVIRTPNTDLRTDLTFQFDSFPDFEEFTTKIHWQTVFKNSTVSFTDISFFAPDLAGINKSLTIDGNFKGSVSNFKGKNVVIQWGKQSMFHGDVSLSGLPYIDNTFMEITADEIFTDKKDIEWVPVPPFDGKHFVSIPQNLSLLGNVKFKGKFTGFISDFVAYGNVSTAIGSISSDINLKFDNKNKTAIYSGNLAAAQFDVGKLIGSTDLGSVTFKVNVKGSGLKLDDINSKLQGKIDQIEFKKYSYSNIVVDGQIAKKLFNGSLSINEENVEFDFFGSVDYRDKLPEFDFTADIKKAHLNNLNLFQSDEQKILKTTIRSHITGDRIDNIVGGIDIENTDFITGNKLFHINDINIRADRFSTVQTLDILSDNLDAHFSGKFEFARLGDAFKEILPRYLPSVVLPQKSEPGNQDFTYDIRLKNMNLFSEMLFPLWTLAPNTKLTGHFRSLSNDLLLDFTSSWIKFKGFVIGDIEMHTNADNNELNLVAFSKNITQKEDSFIVNPFILIKAQNNKLDYKINFDGVDSTLNSAFLKGSINFFSASSFKLKIDTSSLVINGKQWSMDYENQVAYDSTSILFKSFGLSSMSESISLNGSIGKNPDDKLKLQLVGFDLDHLNSFIGFRGKSFIGGIVNGDVLFKDVYNKFQVESDLKISNLILEQDTLGNASINSRYISEQDVFVTDVSIVKGTAKIVNISGNYYIKKENDNLDFNIQLSNLYIHPLERYLEGVVSEVYGKVSADLKLTGSFNKPVFNGNVNLNKTSLIVDYLNTRYSFNSEIKVKENEFQIEDLKLVDVNNNEAIAKGKVKHYFFKNFQFDVELQAKRFQVLNTTINENSLYYGIANASGYARFEGPIDNMNMDISMSPDKGTKLNIPLNTVEDIGTNSFITFIDRSNLEDKQLISNRVDLSGVNLNMNLDMNRNAEIKIIFDEKIGDVITGTGTGSLRLDINTAGNFNMYGTYYIEKGEYLFTLQNLINKKFIILPGGRITWAGDPYEAIVDLSAVYVVHTSSLYNILQDTTYKRRVPVDCKLNLTNKLMNPSISYDISVRGLDPTVESLLQTKLNSEQEINRQMFGLLMFNQFLPISGAGQAGTRLDAGAGAEASATELLSNQVSNWLGQLSTDVNISVNYRARDNYSNEELRVMVSKSFLDERLTIEGNVGFLGEQSYLNNNVVGDFYAEYKVSEDGRFRVKGFNRSNADDIIKYSQSPYTQGLGFFYRKDFNKFSDLFKSMRKKNSEQIETKP